MITLKSFFPTSIVILISVFVIFKNIRAQSMHGRVLDQDSVGVSSVTVTIPGLHRVTSTGYDGSFVFDHVPSGKYSLSFRRIGYDSLSIGVVVSSGTTPVLVVMRSNYVLFRGVTVTAGPQPMDIANSSQSVSVVEGRRLAADAGSSAESGLSSLPGVSMVHDGPFSQKPVIRGLGYQRVIVLEDGVRHAYQSWDDDDSPGIDALSLERVEIVRGPNSVLYGSDALGGVINFIHDDGTIDTPDTSAMRWAVTIEGLSNNTEGAVHAGLNGKTPFSKYYADVTVRGAGNVRTPKGILPNTGESELDFEGAASTDRNWGSLLLGYSRFSQDRQILTVGSDQTSDSPYQSTVHGRAWVSYKTRPSVSRFSVDCVYQQNDGAEYEDEDSPFPSNHLRLQDESVDSRYYFDGWENNSATVGFSAVNEQNATLGPEPVVPAYRQLTAAAFLYDGYRLQDFDLSVGARYDRRSLATSDNAALDLVSETRNYRAFTGSFGLLWHVSEDVSFGMDIGSGWRAPNVEELFIEGLQEGSLMYKLGNPDLQPEQSFSTDFIARVTGRMVTGEISAYYNRVNRYIYLAPTGQIDSASGVMKYAEQQANATLTGVDARLSRMLSTRLTLTVGGDFMMARNDNAQTWLPLTPANRIVLEMRYRFPRASFITEPYLTAGSDIVFDQNRVAPDEVNTPGYTLFNVGFGGTIIVLDRVTTIDCRIHNLFNRAYHDNMSLYRLYAFEPGFDFRLNVTVPFAVV